MVAGWEATVYTVFRPITLTSQPTHKESFERPVFGGIRWAFCPIIAEWIQSLQTDMFTKLCVGGVREITCATLNNRGLIMAWGKSAKWQHVFFSVWLAGKRSLLWSGCYFELIGLLDMAVSLVAPVKEWFKEFSHFLITYMCMSCDLDVKESWATLNERHGATWNAGCLRLERSCGGDSWINMCVQADLLSFFTSGITESSSHRETQDLSLDPSIVSISKGHFIKFFSVINTLISLVVWYMKNVMDSSRRWEHWTDLTFPNAATFLFSSVHRLLLHPDMFETVLPLYGLSLCLLFIVKKISWLWCNVKPWSASPLAEL